MGLLATGTSCLAEVNVMGRSRVPRPPERINPFISRPIIAVLGLRPTGSALPHLPTGNVVILWSRLILTGERSEGSDSMKTLKEMLAEARQVIPEQGPTELKRRLDAGEPVLLVDVRDPDEYRDGFIEPATNISRGFLEFRIGAAAADPSTPIVLYCQTGLRSMLAAKALKELGYQNVVNLQGGFQRWAQSGLPVVKDRPLTTEQIQRYSRHFLLSQVGEKGQRKLLRSKVLLIGAGGLGSPAALYLAAAGVGTIGLIDVDNVMDIIKDYELVVDRSDNFDTRYLVNDACYLAGKTNVHGSIFQFEGMATVFAPNQGPCYRCLYPTPPPPGLVPS